MLIIKNVDVYEKSLFVALRGMRNPMDSWNKSDSSFNWGNVQIGTEDLKLAQKLIRSGTDHSKFMRQIQMSVDIEAPLYWWKEFDTYKVGTTANSCSTMHKIHSKEITLDDFSTEQMTPEVLEHFIYFIDICEITRKKYIETKDKAYWYSLIQMLPSSYMQMRTVSMSYQNLRQMYFARREHKQDEWRIDFCKMIESLPYAKELIMYNGE